MATPEPRDPAALAQRIQAWLRAHRAELVEKLEELVEAESPSTDPAALTHCARLLSRHWRQLGLKPRLLAVPQGGPHLLVEIPGRHRGRPILLVGHYDTVHPRGTLSRAPFRQRGERAFGPGVLDMKAGLVIAWGALAVLLQQGEPPWQPVHLVVTSDEETGSHRSRHLLERLAWRCAAVFVLEPAGSRGALKTARKGTGEVELIVHGRTAHAGLEPQAGINAVHELLLQLQRIVSWNEPARGTTVNVGIIEGGTRSNVIPDRARAVIDFRVSRLADGRAIERRLAALRPILPGARLEIRGGINRPPMERTLRTVQLVRHAQRIGRYLGLTLGEASVGGGSDGNFTAALGVPTLDGLGGVGGGAHTLQEFVEIPSLLQRAALLALLLAFPLPPLAAS